MAEFYEIKPDEFEVSPFKSIGKDWMLVTSGSKEDGNVNTMTASWGGLGVMWGKNVSFVVIRPQRYTKEFVDREESFSLSFLKDSYRKTLNYLGTVSGRDENKIEKAQLKVVYDEGVPYFEESDYVIICKKLYAQPYGSEFFVESGLDEKWYPEKDYHTMYISEVTKILKRK